MTTLAAPVNGEDAPSPLTAPQKVTLGLLGAASAALAAMSFSGMFTAVRTAMTPFFAAGAWMIPVGTDLGIILTSVFSVFFEWLGMTVGAVGARVATLVFIGLQLGINISAGHGNPEGSAGHAVLPLLFVVILEAWQYFIRRRRGLGKPRKPGKDRERIPFARYRADWRGSRELRKFMVLWGIDGYAEALDTMQRIQRAKASLALVYGVSWREECPADILLMLGTAKFLNEAITEIGKIRAAFDKGQNPRSGWQQRTANAGNSAPPIPAPNGNGKSAPGADGRAVRPDDCRVCTVHRAKARVMPLPLPLGDARKVWAEWANIHPGQQLGADPLRIVFGIGMQPARKLRDELKAGDGSAATGEVQSGPVASPSGNEVQSGPGAESAPRSGGGVRSGDNGVVGPRVLVGAVQ